MNKYNRGTMISTFWQFIDQEITLSMCSTLCAFVFAIHHFEEHVLLNFRWWREESWGLEPNKVPTEGMICILMCVSFINQLAYDVKKTNAAADSLLYFILTTQFHNFWFHLVGTIWTQRYSPGLITATFLYLPASILCCYKYFQDRRTRPSLLFMGIMILVSGINFWCFEFLGPKVIPVVVLMGARNTLMGDKSRPLKSYFNTL